MLVFRKTERPIESLSVLDSFTAKEFSELRKSEENSELYFVVPDRYVTNADMNIYKIGFVCSFLKKLYPDKKFNDICEIMKHRYHIFLSRRQIERILSKFNSNNKFTK